MFIHACAPPCVAMLYSFPGAVVQIPWTGCLKTAQVYSLTVLEARVWNQGVSRLCSVWRLPFLLLPAAVDSRRALACPHLVATSLQSLPHLHITLSSSLCASYKAHVSMDKGPTPIIHSDLLTQRYLITSANTFFPNKVTVTDGGS